jgi:hypothetical protein
VNERHLPNSLTKSSTQFRIRIFETIRNVFVTNKYWPLAKWRHILALIFQRGFIWLALTPSPAGHSFENVKACLKSQAVFDNHAIPLFAGASAALAKKLRIVTSQQVLADDSIARRPVSYSSGDRSHGRDGRARMPSLRRLPIRLWQVEECARTAMTIHVPNRAWAQLASRNDYSANDRTTGAPTPTCPRHRADARRGELRASSERICV